MFYRFALALLFLFSFISSAQADSGPKPDDTVSFTLSAEDWVATKTAHVTLDVEAAVNASNAGSVRADVTKAVNEIAKADWRLTEFNRAQDQTGMERWSVVFDARLAESALNGLNDAVKKASKAGMQISVGKIDFSPTLDETEAVRAALRARILKEAGEQLAALNAALPGRSYRISEIVFDTDIFSPIRMIHSRPMMAPVAMAASAPAEAEQSQDISQKLVLNAHITFAAVPPITPPVH
jgi:uncharacterized protein YggE